MKVEFEVPWGKTEKLFVSILIALIVLSLVSYAFPIVPQFLMFLFCCIFGIVAGLSCVFLLLYCLYVFCKTMTGEG